MTEKEKLDLITQISLDINEVKDVDLLLERILTNVRLFFNADAGSIYLREGDELKFKFSQNRTLQKRLAPGKKLIYNTFSIPINNRSIAGHVALNKEPVSIQDVYNIDSEVPYTFDSDFDEISDYLTRSMLTVPIINQRKEILGVMQVINAMDEHGNIIPFSDSDQPLVMHFASSAGLAIERAQITRNIILRMIKMAEMRDPTETAAHVNRVGAYSVEIYETWARANAIPPAEVEKQKDALRMAAMLHDVGKVAISDLILKKPGTLTADEFEIIKSHTYLGARLFIDIQSDFDAVALEVALNHHEKWDGTGYPGRCNEMDDINFIEYFSEKNRLVPKRGKEIPIFGRIVAVADVYDALCSKRAYKKPWEEDKVIEEMKNSSGSHFDPDIVAAFFDCYDMLKFIQNKYPDLE